MLVTEELPSALTIGCVPPAQCRAFVPQHPQQPTWDLFCRWENRGEIDHTLSPGLPLLLIHIGGIDIEDLLPPLTSRA